LHSLSFSLCCLTVTLSYLCQIRVRFVEMQVFLCFSVNKNTHTNIPVMITYFLYPGLVCPCVRSILISLSWIRHVLSGQLLIALVKCKVRD
uniref:Uncharacterized protein n=1 Tax=Periophthalmus magnuspinnatus TaxID=409849 RepID=A0A3B4AH32_9GOBI